MYTTNTLIANKLDRSLSDEEVQLLTEVSDGIDDYINYTTGTQFGSDESVSVYVSGDGNKTLTIPTMHEITSVELVDGDYVEDTYTDYVVHPRDTNKPIYALRKSLPWPEGDDNIKITGKLGYKDVPSDIVLAATLIGVQMLESRSDVSSESVGDWSASYRNAEFVPKNANDILNRYKRLSLKI